jgi:hypothetical protein
MSHDIFEQLTTSADVPPPPESFDRDVHRRLNKALLAMHLAEFVFKTSIFALAHFARAMVGAVVFTISGTHVTDRR